jgi:hypothetical protein
MNRSVLLCFRPSPSAAAPIAPKLLPIRLYRAYTVVSWVSEKDVERMRAEKYHGLITDKSVVRALLCFRASPIAAAPTSPMSVR